MLHVPHHWSTDEFLNNASKQLGLRATARYMFTKDGVEIDDLSMVGVRCRRRRCRLC